MWEESLRASRLLRDAPAEEPEEDKNGEGDADELKEAAAMYRVGQSYAAGKWGRFLRAPDLYFRLIHDYGDRFVRLGEVLSSSVEFSERGECAPEIYQRQSAFISGLKRFLL